MKVAGIDVGAGTAKAVILDDDKIISYSVLPVSGNVDNVVRKITEDTLNKGGLSLENLEYTVSTGYGRKAVSFADKTASEIICHGAGIHFLMPRIRTIIDIGAQDSKAIRVDEEGRVTDFLMNDKCAAGTGRFLEVMARVLGLKLDEMGPISLKSENPCNISSTCTVFAESEVVTLRSDGRPIEDIVSGIHRAIASRVVIMGSGIKLEPETVFTGGVALNSGVKDAIMKVGNIDLIIPERPQITGALGAALIAGEELKKI